MSNGHQVSYGNSIINFHLLFSNRKTLGITVLPDSSVHVTAPNGSSLDRIISKVERRAGWILKQIRKNTQNASAVRNREWVSGESVYYLGRQYRLKVIKGDPSVKLAGKFLWVSIKDRMDKPGIEKLVATWYKLHASKKLRERVDHLSGILQREKVAISKVIIQKLSHRWGSCTEKGNIILNVNLVKAPIDCIDYVIIHEMCHLKHLNHGKRFYTILSKYVPNWPNIKKKLDDSSWE